MPEHNVSDNKATQNPPSWVTHATSSRVVEIETPTIRKVLSFVAGLAVAAAIGAIAIVLLLNSGVGETSLYQKAVELRSQGKNSQAMAAVQQALNQVEDPKLKERLLQLKAQVQVAEKLQIARQLRASGHLGPAVKILEELIERFPDEKEAKKILASIKADEAKSPGQGTNGDHK